MLRKRERILLASLALSILILVPTVLNREHRSAEGYKGDYILADVLDTLARLHLVYDREVARRQLLDSLRADLEYFEMARMPSEFERYRPRGFAVPLVYIRGQGFNVHPTNAMNLATEALQYRGNWSEFREIIDWMLTYSEEKDGSLFFNFYFQWESPGIPWNSSLSQGLAAGYYAIAYRKFGDPRFLRAAGGFANSFFIPREKGGFAINTSYGRFFLEYSNAPDDLVLNGFMLSLKGLTIYSHLTDDVRCRRLVMEGLRTLHRMLPDYDTGNWSLYSTKHGKADESYHRLHVRLLYFLGRWYHDDLLLKYAERWDSYLGSGNSELGRAEQDYLFWWELLKELKGVG